MLIIHKSVRNCIFMNIKFYKKYIVVVYVVKQCCWRWFFLKSGIVSLILLFKLKIGLALFAKYHCNRLEFLMFIFFPFCRFPSETLNDIPKPPIDDSYRGQPQFRLNIFIIIFLKIFLDTCVEYTNIYALREQMKQNLAFFLASHMMGNMHDPQVHVTLVAITLLRKYICTGQSVVIYLWLRIIWSDIGF